MTAPPLLSVIVRVHNDQDQLRACVDSLLEQTLRRIEVILIDDGSTDHSAKIIAEYAKRDQRVRPITSRRFEPGSARNAGVARATAPFITFVDTSDTIPSAAYAHLVNTLERTGSDFAVGAVRGLKRGQSSRPAWVSEVHRVKRLRITIEDFPDAMHDVITSNRVFRREFFDERVGPFPTGVTSEDHALMVTAYVRAKSFDLVPATTCNVRIREDPTSIWQQKHQFSNLESRVAAQDMAWEVVADEASPTVASAWLGRVLDFDLSLLVEFAIHADDEYRHVVRAAARRFTERADASAWRHVRVDRKLRLALAAVGEWVLADRSIEYFRVNGSIPPTRVVDGRILADLPEDLQIPTSAGLFELGEQQTSLAACIRKVTWQANGCLEVEGWAFIQGVDLSNSTPAITAHLINSATSERMELDVRPFSSPAITRWSNHANHRYDAAGFRLSIPADALARSDVRQSTRWQLIVSADADGVTRQGAVHSLVRSGIAMRMRAAELSSLDQPHRVVPLMDDELGFVVQIRLDRLRATALDYRGPRQLGGTIRILRPLASPLTRVVARQNGRTVVKSRLIEQPDGSYGFAISLPVKDRPVHWDFRVLDERGRLHRVSWPSEPDHGTEIGGYGAGTARWRRSPRGFVQLSSRPALLSAHSLQVSEDRVIVEVLLHGADPAILEAALLRSALLSVPADRVEAAPAGRHRLVFAVLASQWGSGVARPLPTGTYSIVVPDELGGELSCGVAPDLMETMPQEHLTPNHGVTLARKPGADKLTIALRAPLTEDERGPSAQRRLAQWYTESNFVAKEQVFFQCYRGEFATDSQRSIHDELSRRGATLDLVWGVYDRSVDLPEGARAVLMGSREWYEAIASSKYLCNNNDFDRFFHRRSYQKFLQTFHGYPFKSMGVSFWRARELSAWLIDYECRRRTDAWTSILVPASFCEEIYRQEYLYHGEVLVTGYPRNDVLVNAGPTVRRRILHRLGVSPDKTVVLYAPTWRDTIATGDWSAKFFDALELDVLADALGDDYVLLLRGHNFNMREGVLKASHAQIVDVTRYPEITDLILAADVAVLDYSSLRFDWVLTGKPVLFFVPDLADYLSARTALFEYGPTAPGPKLSTTAEVIEAI
ncbi:MAG: CDP-glycerol glycerophosphotransferase family protein, partial [Propionibacteriaceae bacterium]|nr:CDP-glycerol glycerophosphotransferase family protein [Propionibacteriaceae bacterium]